MHQPMHHSFMAMGGPCDLHFYAPQDRLSALAGRLEAEVRRLERKYSRYDPQSELSRLNANNGQWMTVDSETAGLLDFAGQCHTESEGLFDITTGVLRSVWDFKSGRLPDAKALEQVLERVGWQRLEWNGVRLFLPPGMELDLGGLVKEFAADRLLALMHEDGVSGLVNLAGDIRVTGPQPNGAPWSVGIRHPRESDRLAATLPLSRGALATSGDYERFILVDGQRYCHILHPRTGMPVLAGPSSVSIVAENCLLAGALTTIAMLKGKDAESWLAGLGTPYLVFDKTLTVSGTLAKPSISLTDASDRLE